MVFVLILTLIISCSGRQPLHILIYTKNGEGYVHDNIPASVEALKKLAAGNNMTADASEDPSDFTPENLSRYDVLVFSNTNNDVFDTPEQEAALQEYIRSGGGFVGIHSANATERDWPWFAAMVGGSFVRHAHQQDFNLVVIDREHISTSFLEPVWEWYDDECYYSNHLNPDIHVLLACDLNTVTDTLQKDFPGDVFGDQFPLAWIHEYDGGREFYTALGHKSEHYSDPVFMKHILGGILWAAGREQ